MPPKRMTKMAYRGEAKRRSMRIRSQSGKGSVLVTHEPVTLELSSSKTNSESSSRTESYHSVGNENVGERNYEHIPDVEKEIPVETPDNVPTQDPTTGPEHEIPTSENAPEDQPQEGPVEEENFDSSRFANGTAQLKYDGNYSRRAVLCERGTKLEDYTEAPYELMELFEQRGWVHWVTTSRRAVVPYVREFYANAVLGHVHGRDVINSKVRGKEISLNCEKISFIGHLPAERIPEVTFEQRAQWEEQLHKDNLVKLFTDNPQAEWTTARLLKSGITEKSNILHMIVCSLILPHAYKSTITLEQATIMGKLLLGIPIDLPYYIWLVISHVVGKPESTAGLPFGGLITDIIQHFLGIEEEAGMAVVKPASLIAKTSMKRSQGQLGKKVIPPVEEDNQQQQAEGEAAESVPLTTDEKLELIQKNQEQLMKEVDELKKGQQKLIRLMERIFESDREEEEN